MELICKANICYDQDGQPVLDLRDTDCPPDKAQEFLKKIFNKPGMRVRMPSIIEKPNIAFTIELNKIMHQALDKKERDKKVKKLLKKHGIDEKHYKEVQKYD